MKSQVLIARLLPALLPALLLGLTLTTTVALPASAAAPAKVATPAETAAQVRSQWAEAKKAYEAAVKPYAGKPEYAATLKQFGETLDATGLALEQYLTLKLAAPPTPATKITPVVDQIAKNLTTLRALQGKAGSGLVTVLGAALGQHNQITQNALKNMR